MRVEVCIKCQKCGLPRKGHFDRKSRSEKQTIIKQRQYPVAAFQLAAVTAQKVARSYLVQCRQRRNVPINKWQQKCVHYLYSKGPYGRISKLDQYRRISVYNVAALQIQTVWKKYRWFKHLRLMEPATRNRNAILLQRTYRSNACRRFYAIIRKTMRNPAYGMPRCLISSKTAELSGNTSDLHESVIYRLGTSSFPLALYYQVAKDEDSDSIELKGWSSVERERCMGYMREQIKLQDKRRRRRISRTRSMRRSTREDATELRRERIRKTSRRKFKWFYDRKESSDDQPQLDMSHGNSEGTTKEDVSADSDVEVMAWLRDLDLNNDMDDL